MEINSHTITVEQALNAIKCINANPDAEPHQVEMAMLGLDALAVDGYNEYIRVSDDKPRYVWYNAFIGLTKAIEECDKRDILGVNIEPDHKLFETCSAGAVESMCATMQAIRDEVMAGYSIPDVPQGELTDEQKALVIQKENKLIELYYDNLPKMLGYVVAGVRGEDGQKDYSAEILKLPAVPALAISQCFFLQIMRPKLLEGYPRFYQYTTASHTWNQQSDSGQFERRNLLLMQGRGF